MSSSDSLFNGIDIMLLATLLQIVKLLVCDKTKDIAAVDVEMNFETYCSL